MRKLFLLLIVPLLFACSEEEIEEETQYFITLRDTCYTESYTEYTEYEVYEKTYNEFKDIDRSGTPCNTISFHDITGESIEGFYSGTHDTDYSD